VALPSWSQLRGAQAIRVGWPCAIDAQTQDGTAELEAVLKKVIGAKNLKLHYKATIVTESAGEKTLRSFSGDLLVKSKSAFIFSETLLKKDGKNSTIRVEVADAKAHIDLGFAQEIADLPSGYAVDLRAHVVVLGLHEGVSGAATGLYRDSANLGKVESSSFRDVTLTQGDGKKTLSFQYQYPEKMGAHWVKVVLEIDQATGLPRSRKLTYSVGSTYIEVHEEYDRFQLDIDLDKDK
jgi:hypothetical protein